MFDAANAANDTINWLFGLIGSIFPYIPWILVGIVVLSIVRFIVRVISYIVTGDTGYDEEYDSGNDLGMELDENPDGIEEWERQEMAEARKRDQQEKNRTHKEDLRLLINTDSLNAFADVLYEAEEDYLYSPAGYRGFFMHRYLPSERAAELVRSYNQDEGTTFTLQDFAEVDERVMRGFELGRDMVNLPYEDQYGNPIERYPDDI